MLEENILQLIKCYEQQIALYLEMLSIVKNLHLLCAEADFSEEESLDNLNLLLLKRQEKMDLVEANQEKVEGIKNNLRIQLGMGEMNIKTLFQYFPSPHTEKLVVKIEEIEAILGEIAGLDQESQKNLSDKLKLTEEKLGAIQKKKRVNEIYNPGRQQREGFFIDHNK